MRKLVEIEENTLDLLLGKQITIFCMRYIYTGTLEGVNNTHMVLRDPAIVYETGPFDTKEWKNAQKLPNTWHVMLSSVESFGILK